MLEHFHAGDRIRASQFNRLVDTLCNLRRKIDSLKRGGVRPHLRVNQIARYKDGRGWEGVEKEPTPPKSNYVWKVRTVSYPVWRPPFSMHWKMHWHPTNTEFTTDEICVESRDAVCGQWRYCGEGIIINPGSWFVGSNVVTFPCRVIRHEQIVQGSYWLERDTGCIAIGQMNYGPKIPGAWWPLGDVCVANGTCFGYRIVRSWSGDIWEEPATWITMGSRRDPIAAELIFDFARMASGCVYETCRGETCEHKCKFVPHSGQAKFVGLGMGERYYYPACGAMMIGSYTSRVAEVEWWTGEKPIAVTGSTLDDSDPRGYQPKLCVNLRGRDCERVPNCTGLVGVYRGSPVWVCHKRTVGYKFDTAEPEEFEVYGKILGVAQIGEYAGDVSAQIWPKPGFVQANTINSLWTTKNCRRTNTGGQAEMQSPRGLTVSNRIAVPISSPNFSRWCLHQYIGHGYGYPVTCEELC